MMTESETLTPKEASVILKLKPGTIIRLIRSGKLRGFTVGNGTKRHRWVLMRADVMAYLESKEFVPENNIEPLSRPRIERAEFPILDRFRGRG